MSHLICVIKRSFQRSPKKRSFLLLELLIGISLLTFFLAPLIRDPFFLLQTEIAVLERMELERIAELEFARIKEKIYLQEIPWKTLTQGRHGELLKSEVLVQLPGLASHRFETSTEIWSKSTKKNRELKEEYHLIGIQTIYTPKPRKKHTKSPITFTYRLFVKQTEGTLTTK